MLSPFNSLLSQSLCITSHRSLVVRSRTRRRSGQTGLSLVELMVSLTIGLFLIVGLAALFASLSSSRRELDKSSRQIENGRYAMQILSDEVRHAGYYGTLVSAPASPASSPDPCSTDITEVQASMGLPLQGYVGATTAASLDTGKLGCLNAAAGYKPDTAVIVVRRATTSILGYDSGKFNIQVSGCAGDTAPYMVAAASSAFTLHTNTGPTACKPLESADTAGITPFKISLFYVSTCSVGDCSATAADNVPTLKRVDVTATGTTTTALVEGIENMQFEYGVDTTPPGDGVPDVYVATPTFAQWPNVMTVRVHILARNIDQTAGYVDTKTYELGPVSVTPGGAYKRHAYSELVRLNNPAGRRE